MTAASPRQAAVPLPVWQAGGTRMGFFTDSSICIGCKACEVACKEWNGVPDRDPAWSGNSYDNTLRLGPTAGATWPSWSGTTPTRAAACSG